MKRITVLFSILLLLVPFGALAQDFCEGNFDYDKDVDGSDASTFKSDFGRSALRNPCPTDGPSPVPKTRQLTAYQTYDNGWWNNGLAWPNTRFTDNGDGTVTDNLTGLIWLKDARCLDLQTIIGANWNDALVNAYFLHGTCGGTVRGDCGLTDDSCGGEWRLPNVKELQSLIDFNNFWPALPSGHPFINVQPSGYWSSTTLAINPYWAWNVDMGNGYLLDIDKLDNWYVWPVRGGR